MWIRLLLNAFVVCAALSIPALIGAAFYFDDARFAYWAVIPFILFMAG